VKGDVVDDGPFEPAPKGFNEIPLGAIGRQEHQGQVVAMLGEKRLYELRVVNLSIIENHDGG